MTVLLVKCSSRTRRGLQVVRTLREKHTKQNEKVEETDLHAARGRKYERRSRGRKRRRSGKENCSLAKYHSQSFFRIGGSGTEQGVINTMGVGGGRGGASEPCRLPRSTKLSEQEVSLMWNLP